MNPTLEKIQNLLDSYGWTIYQLAKRSGIPYSSLNSLFHKNNQPSLSTLEKICDGFCISLSEFFAADTDEEKPVCALDKKEVGLIEKYRKLDPRNQKLLLDISKLLEKTSNHE